MQREYTYNFYEFFYDTSFHDYKSIGLCSVSVKVGTYQINNDWHNVEEMLILQNQHVINAEAELVALLTREIDMAIINDLRTIV